MSIDQSINDFFAPISAKAFDIIFYSVPLTADIDVKLLLVWILSAAVFFTLYLGFVNFRYFKHGIDVALGKYEHDTDDGQISSWQALMTSMSGTVGLGNIAGVAVAVSIGGAGAVFWMVVMGFLSMSTKFAEVTLAVKYRYHHAEDHPERISGGPMYYLRDGLNNRNIPFLGSVLSVMFALCCIGGAVGGGNMFQANQAYKQVLNATGGDASFLAGHGWIFGIFLSILVGAVIIGGIKSIANVASRLVPAMAAIYITAALVVIGINYANIPAAFAEIFTQALSPAAGFGGIMGALLVGVQRAAFSNEAGLGSAGIIYAAARSETPVTQGMASMLGPFLDTVVVCTVTALLIVISGAHLDSNGIEGVALTSRALESGISWFPYVLALAVFLFAYSTLIAWFYNGLKAVTFLFGERDSIELAFKVIYCLFVIIGCSASLGNLIDLTDAMLLSMAIPNILGLFILAPEIKRELKDYKEKLKSGEIKKCR